MSKAADSFVMIVYLLRRHQQDNICFRQASKQHDDTKNENLGLHNLECAFGFTQEAPATIAALRTAQDQKRLFPACEIFGDGHALKSQHFLRRNTCNPVNVRRNARHRLEQQRHKNQATR
jgi:hypothetical protein